MDVVAPIFKNITEHPTLLSHNIICVAHTGKMVLQFWGLSMLLWLQAVKNSKPTAWGMDLQQQGSKPFLAELNESKLAGLRFLKQSLKAVQRRLPPRFAHGSLLR